MAASNLGRKRLIWLTCLVMVTAHHLGKPEQELKAGAWRQELVHKQWRNAAYWLAILDFLSCCSYSAQGWSSHSGLGSHTSINNQENAPQTWQQVSLMETAPRLKCSLHSCV